MKINPTISIQSNIKSIAQIKYTYIYLKYVRVPFK